MVSIRRRAALTMSGFVTAAFVVPAVISGSATASPTTDVYDAIGDSPPPNVSSLGFEATSAREFGDRVTLGGTARELVEVTVLMSSWGCESGGWNTGDCSTTPGATFSHDLTLNVYEVDESGPTPAPGAVVASKTQSFTIPYRPSADPACTGGAWKAANGNCYNGFATPVTFDFPAGTTLPDDLIWGIAYNTTHYGDSPMGVGAACYSAPGGCGYDSLNVGASSLPGQPDVGADNDEDVVYADSTWSGFYTDGGAGGTGIFRVDTNWTGYRPLARITVRDSYGFSGFFQPVNNDELNLAKAGQAIPVKWRLTADGAPVSDPSSFVSLTSKKVNCVSAVPEGLDAIEDYTGGSGLLYQGDGNWQFNWKTPKSYAGQCRAMTVTLDDGTTHTAYFQFK